MSIFGYMEAEVRALVGIALERAAAMCDLREKRHRDNGERDAADESKSLGLALLSLDPPAIAELERRDARVRLEEAKWRANRWPPVGAVHSVDALERWIQEREIEQQNRIAALQATADAVEKDASDV